MKLIDADALLEWTNQYYNDEKFTIAQFINVIKDISNTPQWIPVTEKLPENEGKYLVTDEAGGIADILIDDFFQYDDGTWGWMYSQNAVAWMSLSLEPYETN